MVLTPGVYNSAYFEHSFLARRMGVELVEGHDLSVGDDGYVYMRTISGRERVDVIYRRIDDMFLDPAELRPDSTLGVAGLMQAWREGKVAIANAPGAGVADDKVVYAWVPDLIRFYMDEEPLVPNVPTWRCLYPDELRFVLDNMRELVVKPANESGGYGVMIGDRASDEELAQDPRRSDRQSAQLDRPTDPGAVGRARRSATTVSRRATSTFARSFSPGPSPTSRAAASLGSRDAKDR